MQFAINRLDMSSVDAFARSAAKAESLGWGYGLIPCSPLLVRDPYVMLAFAAGATQRLVLGTLLDTPVMRHPAALASSIATVAELAPGRTLLGLGVGDTAVRLNGLSPARVATLERALVQVRTLLAGEALDVGAAKPARLRHAQPVPVWVAAQGPRALKMAGAHADGVFIRVGTDARNIQAAYQQVVEGATAAGRNAKDVKIGVIFHVAVDADAQRARTIAKAIAAGYYEYSPFLFDNVGLYWNGRSVHELKHEIFPDFHHARDLLAAGAAVDFLPQEAVDAFALYGSFTDISTQLERALEVDVPLDIVLPHPMLAPDSSLDYLAEFARQVIRPWR
ncbi:MAG TPA: LLM class flavin-dependent oxidoreductase [Pseudomonadales bacterium]|jgi:5,10-methylenetetrahydromethanopterin reductase|nr:LLM class flavin-dependent oxidoreductase [Pseudomonadales bacterium]